MNHLRSLLVPLTLALGLGDAHSANFSYTNSSGISIGDGSPPTPAAPYPSTLGVAGVPGTILKVTVQLTGLTHTFPGDIDVLLVGPGGTQAVIMSDTGSGTDLSGINVLLDDDAAAFLPTSSAITSGTYKPTNSGAGDTFPAPAPVAAGNSALSAFQGISPNGTWSLYVVDDVSVDNGSLSGWTLNITTAATAQSGQLVISEFRVRGPNGANDEFIEIQNATDSDHIVTSVDGSGGYAVAASNGVARFVIPNGTLIRGRGHYLGTNSVGYSLSSYPAGNGSTATGDATFVTDIPDNAGIALFRTALQANFTLANRLDAVGSTSEANTLYKEGSGYPALTPFSIDYSFYRNLLSGVSLDTGNNAADFVFVDSNGTSAGAGQRLGAAGPENLSSPIRLRTGPSLVRNVLDSGAASTAPPNRVRDFTSDPANNSTFGTFDLRRKFTNNTGVPLTRLRFRVVDLTTFPSPSGISDLRPRTSTNVVVTVTGGANVAVQGCSLEQPPSQPNGGGFNSTFGVGSVTLGSPLAIGASVDVRFLFGIQQTGSVRLALIPETLPASATGVWTFSGHTDSIVTEVEGSVPAPAIVAVDRLPSNVDIDHLCPPGTRYQLQRSLNLTDWIDLGSTFLGDGTTRTIIHSAGAGPNSQFYRLRTIP